MNHYFKFLYKINKHNKFKLDNIIEEKKRPLSIVLCITYILFCLYIFLQSNNLIEHISVLIVFTIIPIFYLWRCSFEYIIPSLIFSIPYLIIYVDIGTEFILSIATGENFEQILILGALTIILSLLWITGSLVCNKHVGKLLNEFWGCISTVFFTTITYISAILAPTYADKILTNIISSEDIVTLTKFGYTAKDFFQLCGVMFLPIIGLNAITILFFSLREYYEKRYHNNYTKMELYC